MNTQTEPPASADEMKDWLLSQGHECTVEFTRESTLAILWRKDKTKFLCEIERREASFSFAEILWIAMGESGLQNGFLEWQRAQRPTEPGVYWWEFWPEPVIVKLVSKSRLIASLPERGRFIGNLQGRWSGPICKPDFSTPDPCPKRDDVTGGDE